MKQYKAIFFDWDGTAVISRDAPADAVIAPMKALLQKGIALIIISGTTYNKICGGKLEDYFTKAELENLFLGLGRGAFNYKFDENGKSYVWKNRVPPQEKLLVIHKICFEVHQKLLSDYNLNTDIVFSRPNYCKIDLMVGNNRKEQLFLQEGEIDELKRVLGEHGVEDGLHTLIEISNNIAKKHGVSISATCDAKYLEIGPTDKSDNTDDILDLLTKERNIRVSDCCFWGDEFIGADDGIFGSDSFMITPKSMDGDFFDVSDNSGARPTNVVRVGGGVGTFNEFLCEQRKATT